MTSIDLLTRKVFCNRTLNMRSIQAIGYDMDYTLIHYHTEKWERRAYEAIQEHFSKAGWPVKNLQFDPSLVCRGLIIDRENGNLVKANRFGFIKRAMHGTRLLSLDEQRQIYSRTIVDLADKRWIFLNSLFSLSEGCMYAQAVDLLDQRKVPEILGYADLYERVRTVLDAAHMEGKLKAEIMANPEKFVILEPETALALQDQFHAGKKLVLITNSEWYYTAAMMSYTFDRFLPKGTSWRDLFELIIVSARKPAFFTSFHPIFEVVTEDGLLKPNLGKLRKGTVYLGGSADQVEKFLGLSGDEILYVGDHMFGDVHVTKNVLRWRTGLIIRELEEEIESLHAFSRTEKKLDEVMRKKEKLEGEMCQIRLALQRQQKNYSTAPLKDSEVELQARLDEVKAKIEELDRQASPLAQAAAELNNPSWGLLMRTGNDKSYLAYQVERYADVYTSRVSNFLAASPFTYLRSPRGSLPHDVG